MAAQASTRPTWSRGLRFVHWLDAIVILGLLGTVILRKTFLSFRTNGAMIQEKLAGMDIDISSDAANGIARAIRAPMWQWHYYLGLALAVLLVCRIFLLFLPDGRDILRTSLLGRDRSVALKKRLYRTLHVVYYVCAALIVATGLIMYFRVAGKAFGTILEIHETLTVFFLIFVPLHVLGAFVAECTDDPGIVSAMIHGRRGEP